MPQVRGFHYDKPLTDMSVAIIQDASAFIGRQVFPQVDSEHRSDEYYEWDRDDFMRDEAQERAPMTEAAVGTFSAATHPFYCKEYAIATDVPWQKQKNADAVLRLDENAVRWVAQRLLIRQDVLWASKFFKAGVWGTDIAGVTGVPNASQTLRWSEAGSQPVEDIDDFKLRMLEQTGHEPNVLVITPRVLKVLKHHADILDRVRYTQMGVITLDLLRAVFDVEKIVVAKSIMTTSKRGAASPTRRFILDDGVLLVHAADSPGVEVASAGYTFTWIDADSGAGEFGGGIRRYPMEKVKADRVEGEFTIDQKVIAKDLGVFVTSIV